MPESGDQALKLEQLWVLFAEHFGRFGSAVFENARIFLGVDRETMLPIDNVEFTARRVKIKLEFAALQHRAIMIVKDSHQHFSVELIFQRLPVYVKKTGVNRRFTILQHIEPPGVIAAHHPHMIGDNVEDQSHAVLVERGDKAVELLSAADLRVEGVVIHDVVSMHAAGASLQARRDIAVTDAKCGKIGNNFGRLSKPEVAIELQAIGRERDV